MQRDDLLNELRIDRRVEETSNHSRGWLIATIAIVAVVGVGLTAWLAMRPLATTVEVAAARAMSAMPANTSVLDASGYVTARRMATVSSKITGKVAEVMIEEGMRVEANQVLARLDDIDARDQVALVQAQLDASRSQRSETKVLLAQAERELKRQAEMNAKKLTSAQALDNAQSQVESLRARLASADQQSAVTERSLQVARQNLDNTIVRAPFGGVVTVKAAQPGEMVSPLSAGGGFTRTGIGTIVDMDSLEIEVDVNESFINRVVPGQPVEAVLNAYQDWKIPATVIAIIPTADRTKATVKVRVGFNQRDPRILPDMGVRVAFLEEQKSAAQAAAAPPAGVLVPAAAIRTRGDKSEVLVYKSGKLERRAVALGKTYGDSRQLTAGVRDGEQVVLSPGDELRDGDTVALKTNNSQ